MPGYAMAPEVIDSNLSLDLKISVDRHLPEVFCSQTRLSDKLDIFILYTIKPPSDLNLYM